MKNEIKTPQIAKVESKTESHSQTSSDLKKLNLSNRQANCAYGKHAIVSSNESLPFFEFRPERETDVYYCGCYGWN